MVTFLLQATTLHIENFYKSSRQFTSPDDFKLIFKAYLPQFHKHKSSSRRQISVNEIASTRMTFRQWHMIKTRVNTIKAAENVVISAQNDFVSSWKFHANAIIGEGSLRIEIEHKNVTVSFKSDDFVTFMCPSDVTRIAVEPAVTFFR